jgi:hypothetical protein
MRAVARRNETRRARFSPPLARRQQSFCPPYGSSAAENAAENLRQRMGDAISHAFGV